MKALIRFSTLTVIFLAASAGLAQTTSFTYQGRLTDGSTPANGSYDLQFALFDSVSGGTQIGATQTLSAVTVTGGVFTVQLNFGAGAFPGANRFLEIAVRPAGGGSFTTLAQRQQISSTPYAVRSLTATTADGLSAACVNCVSSSQISSLPAGNGNYIQNTTTPQATSNFSISGNGTAGGTLAGNLVNATTQYNLGGSRILSGPGTNNLFVGLNAAATGPTGFDNTYVGNDAGNASTTGDANSFFGVSAGFNNRGNRNSFFGRSTGLQNTTGEFNSFFGVQAGRDNTNGYQNSFFGWQAGLANGGGERNSFFGAQAGLNNMGDFGFGRGGHNSFFGANAGSGNTTGSFNSFFGETAGDTNTTGSSNTAIGTGAGFASPNLFHASAIGAFARVATNFTMVLGNGSAGTNVVIGADGSGIGSNNTRAARLNVFGGPLWTSNGWKSAVKIETGSAIGWDGDSHSFGIGRSAGGLYFFRTADFIGEAFFPAIYDLVISEDGLIGLGTTVPQDRLDVNGNIRIGLGVGGDQFMCRGSVSRQVATCGSSLRYKKEVRPLLAGLNLISRLRPINFVWKESGARDIGLGAEDVAQVEPLLVTHNDKGEIEGVKYAQLSAVLINAIKEQQAQIETLRSSNATLQSRLTAVEKELRRRAAQSRRRR